MRCSPAAHASPASTCARVPCSTAPASRTPHWRTLRSRGAAPRHRSPRPPRPPLARPPRAAVADAAARTAAAARRPRVAPPPRPPRLGRPAARRPRRPVSLLGALSLAGAPSPPTTSPPSAPCCHCGSLTSLDLSLRRRVRRRAGVVAAAVPPPPPLRASQLPRVASSPSRRRRSPRPSSAAARRCPSCGSIARAALAAPRAPGSNRRLDAPALRGSRCARARTRIAHAPRRRPPLARPLRCVALDAADVERALPSARRSTRSTSRCRRLRALRLASPSLTFASAGARRSPPSPSRAPAYASSTPTAPCSAPRARARAADGDGECARQGGGGGAAVTTPATPTTPAAVNGAPPSPSCAGQLLELQCRAHRRLAAVAALRVGALRLLNLTDCAAAAAAPRVGIARDGPPVQLPRTRRADDRVRVARAAQPHLLRRDVELTLRCRASRLLCAGCRRSPTPPSSARSTARRRLLL